MAHHNTVFAQMLKLIPRHEFESLACQHLQAAGNGQPGNGQIAVPVGGLDEEVSAQAVLNIALDAVNADALAPGVIKGATFFKRDAGHPIEDAEILENYDSLIFQGKRYLAVAARIIGARRARLPDFGGNNAARADARRPEALPCL